MTIAFALMVITLVIGRELESRRHARVIADLCQRLQDPGAAVAQHAIQVTGNSPVQHLPFDDDAAWAAYQQTGVISTDELG